MGMFDYINVSGEVMPPGFMGEDADGQTKSLDCALDSYVIGETGELYRNGEPLNYHGDMFFHCFYDGKLIDFQARYTEGELQWIRKLD